MTQPLPHKLGERIETMRPRLDQFSQRELQCVVLVANGCTAPQAAARLHLSPWTVKTHLNHARLKLGAHTNAQLVARALVRGWLDPEYVQD